MVTSICIIIMPSNPKELFEKHFIVWAEDFEIYEDKKGRQLRERQIRTLVLLDIKKDYKLGIGI